MGNASALAGLLLLFGATTATPAVAHTSPDGAYEALSPGHQKIARALYEAQQPNLAPAKPGTRATRALTLGQIAAQKNSGKAWGRVFSDMKAKGLVRERNLDQVVSRAQHRSRPPAPGIEGVASAAPVPR